MDYVLDLKDLRKEYKGFTLDNISLKLPRGTITGLIGPNGAGKTTTIKLIMNMLKKKSGDISIFGLNYKNDEKEIKNRIGYVGEDQYFYQNKTIKWTEKFVSGFYKNWDSDTFSVFIKKFKLPVNKKIKNFSKGMKVKLSFAVALSHNPELLILDEPTSGLDPIIRREILDLLIELKQKEELSVFVSSHITDDLFRISDNISYMVDGKIIISEVKDELLARWKKINYKPDSLPEGIEKRLMNVEKQLFGSSGITNKYPELVSSLTEGIKKGDIKIENVGLDDILISLVNGE